MVLTYPLDDSCTPYLSVLRGACEARSKTYLKYGARGLEQATMQNTKSYSGAAGSAGWQTVAVRRQHAK